MKSGQRFQADDTLDNHVHLHAYIVYTYNSPGTRFFEKIIDTVGGTLIKSVKKF